jgi:hypothetical protein
MAQSRWIPAVVLVASMVIVSLAAGPAAASKVPTVKSTVTITSGEGSQFSGKVSSAKKQCRAKRTVKLYMEPGSARAGDSLVGTAKTDASGAWTMDGSFLAAVYYAQVVPLLVRIHGAPYRCAYDWSMPMRY